MMLFRISVHAEKGCEVLFPLFLFSSAITVIQVNNLFHLSAPCLLRMLAENSVLRR
ncbi:MAG: hypothetical protein GPOALKHO_001074 [Sodalis sp.]|nr:MAG: hypothetical protein GPOALKHO_001074 [Sodalis sp.]